ncbi:MAG: 3-hydroxyisobutyrate dehydrogenase [Acidobacteria bacterium]|nr:MAG: 3-hydroxyisobutyrate dehydrogenase [Acidobacteriota bacterium]
MAEIERIGFVGLGSMGFGMATQLLKKGFEVSAVDSRSEVKERWLAAGGTWCDSLAAVAINAKAVVVMVVNSEQVESVLFGDKGVLKSLNKGSVVVVTSTLSPSYSKELGNRLAEAGYLYLDAPVSGGVVGAESGSLSIMVSGSARAFESGEPLLKAMATKIYRIGEEPGLGSIVKTVNQLLAGAHIALAAEAMAFGAKAGVDPEVLYEVVSHSAGSSWMFNDRVPHMLAGDFSPRSAVNIFVKDLGIVLDVGRELKFPLPMAALAHQIFVAAAAAGLGTQDDSAVVKLFQNLSGTPVARKSNQ